MTEFDSTHAAETDSPASHRIDRRVLFAGLTGLGLAGTLGVSRTLAQEEPSDEDGARVPGAAYDDFIGKLAANLGNVDATVLDTAIRDALKAMIDERFDEGSISSDRATRLKERIDTSETPLAVVMLGGGNRRRRRRKNRRDDASDDNSTAPIEVETPPA